MLTDFERDIKRMFAAKAQNMPDAALILRRIEQNIRAERRLSPRRRLVYAWGAVAIVASTVAFAVVLVTGETGRSQSSNFATSLSDGMLTQEDCPSGINNADFDYFDDSGIDKSDLRAAAIAFGKSQVLPAHPEARLYLTRESALRQDYAFALPNARRVAWLSYHSAGASWRLASAQYC